MDSIFITFSTGIITSINGCISLADIVLLYTLVFPATTTASFETLYFITRPSEFLTGIMVLSLFPFSSLNCSAKLTSYSSSNVCAPEETFVPLLIIGA